MPLENTDAEERITRETMIGWIEHWGESYDEPHHRIQRGD